MGVLRTKMIEEVKQRNFSPALSRPVLQRWWVWRGFMVDRQIN
jgi:hypothetical protein